MKLQILPLKQIKIIALFALIVIIFGISSFPISTAYASTSADQQRLDEIQRQLANLSKQRKDLKSKIKNQKSLSSQYGAQIVDLNNDIQDLELSVQEKQLTIDELNLKIKGMTEDIAVTEQEIINTQNKIGDLQLETDGRLADMYLDIKSYDNSVTLVFNSNGESDFVKDGLYREAIQEETNGKLDELALAKANLEADKAKLEQDKITVEKSKTQLEEERKALESNQTDLDQKKSKYEALKRGADTSAAAMAVQYATLSDSEAQLLAEEEYLMQKVFNQVGSLKNGSAVKAGTQIGNQGLTGLTTGYHLHFAVQKNKQYINPCSVVKSLTTANGVACGVSNSPLSNFRPMTGTYYFTSGYGMRTLGSTTKFHYGVDLANTSHNAPIYATHDGWLYKGFEPCNSSYSLCKSGGANWVIICQDKSCATGYKTMYWHLK
jgi:septal ring factor EnvC (AmiA/AmiB activator)